jgi:branched-chain amino acid transport system substrate-binding protein
MSHRLRLGMLLTVVLAVVAAGTTAALASSGSTSAVPIKIGILSDCKGPFGNQYNADIGGALTAFSQYAGARPKNPNNPSAGLVGGSVGGHPIKIVGFGCSDATPDLAIKETRRLVEQLGAQILIGPLSGDEAVAVAHYAQAHPRDTFVNGTAGSQDPTLQIAPKNFFRFNGDGAQWNAGVGKIAIDKLHWKTAAIIMDDYSFGWTSAAGMIADFCARGGNITKRVFAPLGTTDFSSLVRQLPPPNKVDGYFWVVGGSATVPSLKAFVQAYGQLSPKKIMGNLFFSVTGNFQEIAPQINGAYTGGFGTPGFDYVHGTPQKQYIAIAKHWFKQIPPLGAMNVANAYNGFFFNYYKAAWGLVKGLQAVKGNIASSQLPLQAALAKVTLNTAFGKVSLDSNRQAVEAEWSYQIGAKSGKTTVSTVQYIPNVNQSFSGLFTHSSPPPSRTQPACKKATLSWAGKEQPVVGGVIK